MSRSLDDIILVGSVNAAAFIVSITEFEQELRILGLFMACVYTGLKIYKALTGNE